MKSELRTDATAYMIQEIPPTTKCKHGPGNCAECGTTNRRDVVHTTRGGQGVVGGLRQQQRKRPV